MAAPHHHGRFVFSIICITMKQLQLCTCALALLLAQTTIGQQKTKYFGAKAGVNVTSISDHAIKNNTGFFVGGYFSAPSKTIGYRTELLFSRQGYDYSTSAQTGTVKMNYLMMPQLMTLNITRFVQLQAGAQLALLLSTKVDSSANPSSIPYAEKAKDYFAKINYGFAAGIEIHPVAGLTMGGRYNFFANTLSNQKTTDKPAYLPSRKENGLWQLSIGYQF